MNEIEIKGKLTPAHIEWIKEKYYKQYVGCQNTGFPIITYSGVLSEEVLKKIRLELVIGFKPESIEYYLGRPQEIPNLFRR
jgi:hypothetical protein